MSEGQRLWYVSTVYELIVEVLGILFPESLIVQKFYDYCHRKHIQIISPAMGAVDTSQRKELMETYLLDPIVGLEKMKDFLND